MKAVPAREYKKRRSWSELALRGMSDGLSIFDSQYRWVFMNRADESRMARAGKDPALLLGKAVWDAWPGLSGSPAEEKMREAMEKRISASFEQELGGYWYEINLSPIDGGVAAVTQDITRRKRSEEELRRTQEALQQTKEELEERVRQRTAELAQTLEKLRTRQDPKNNAEEAATQASQRMYNLTELLPVGIMILTPDSEVIFENRFLRERFGPSDSKHCYELLFGRNSPCEHCLGRKAFNKNSPQYWESLDKNGRCLYGLHEFPFEQADGSPAILVIAVDITERKQAELQLKAANKQLAARAEQLRALLMELSRTEDCQRRSFAQVLHDELQQLLVATKFSTEYLLHRVTGEAVMSEAHRILDLVTQSISLTRSLTSQLSPPVLYESSFVGSLQWLSRWMQKNHGLTVELSAPENAPDLTEELRVMVFQSVRELLFNVVKHAGAKKATVIVACDGETAMHVTVADQGIGFKMSDQLETTPGSFGLFSIRERLSILGGKMEIETLPGRGTKIRLHIPIQDRISQPGQYTAKKPEVIPEESITEPGLARVLVVDDHTVVREGLVEILQKQPGMLVVGEAVDGQEAVEQARELHPTTILMDITLPRMSGIDATRIIKHEMPNVSVIALSMHPREDMAGLMREAGATRYLLKDSPVGELITAIYETVNVRTQRIA